MYQPMMTPLVEETMSRQTTVKIKVIVLKFAKIIQVGVPTLFFLWPSTHSEALNTKSS